MNAGCFFYRLTDSLECGVLVEVLDRLLLFIRAGDLPHSWVRLTYQTCHIVHLIAV